ncbi:PREDICTED: zinc finger CCCH domain-containing protein 62 [Tarenaya hassleriana]|uniref:zinc finger CCCH domain-containing protein 62 n=1 Tax=Tarenaya hassleriana TaxID=28532 RepID=UPI00053C833A|nr:PREDICTED: zinc finger CCCH domain-containing protein 62 [Tarenaya hassleriana]
MSMAKGEEEIVDLCSSENEEEEDDGGENEEYDDKEDEDDDDEEEEEEEEGGLEETDDEDWSLSGYDSEWSEDDLSESDMDDIDDDDDDDDDNDGGGDDEDSLVNKVIQLLKEGRDLKVLKVKECKAYLRKNRLRLAGTKAVCIERIVEHWRVKDGNGEVVYPQSSFVINCKGNVCKGDTILFTQKVYQKFEKMKRSGNLLGTRTVAGKVVKESYGSAKQQHTFTIEVCWSKGGQKLPALHPLLVKGRNLYRLRTFRQPWATEEDRLRVLSEKYKRGAAARMARDTRKERKMKSAFIERRKSQNQCREKKSSQGRTRKVEKENIKKGHDNPTRCFRQEMRGSHAFAKHGPNPSWGNNNPTERRNVSKPTRSYTPHSYVPRPWVPNAYVPRSSGPHSYATFNVSHSHVPYSDAPNSYPYAYQTQNPYVSQNQRPPPLYDGSSTSNANRPACFDPQPQAYRSNIPVSYRSRSHGNHHTRHANSYHSHHNRVRDLDRFSEMRIDHRPGGETYRRE